MLFVAFSLMILVFFFVFNLVSLINMCLSVFLFGLSCNFFLHFLELGEYFISHVRDVFAYNLLKYFFQVLSYFSSSGTCITCMLSLRSLETVFISCHSFVVVLWQRFLPLFSWSLVHSLAQVMCYWFLLMYFSFQLLSFSALFLFVFFSSSRSLLNFCIFYLCLHSFS